MDMIKILCAGLWWYGLWYLLTAMVTGHYSHHYHHGFQRLGRWCRQSVDLWDVFPLNKLVEMVANIIPVNPLTQVRLERQLTKAGSLDSTRIYMAKIYVILCLGSVVAVACYLLQWYFGVLVTVLVVPFLLLKMRDRLTARIREKDNAIGREMPVFVGTICRNLHHDRDLYRVISSYRKVAGWALGQELDKLLADMQAGNTQKALLRFQGRLGTGEASQLCSALVDLTMGTDQTATLRYLADTMAVKAKENIRKELSKRPNQMRATYYPAMGVCVAMILYVMVVYVVNSLNGLF